MGLFGKKRVEEPEVEDLTANDLDKETPAEQNAEASEPAVQTSEAAPEQRPEPATASVTDSTPSQAPIPLMSKKEPMGNYGFAQVRDLMRTIPLAENRELVVQVVKKTLESANISLQAIVEDAKGMQDDAKSKIHHMKQTISELQQEIANHKKEVVELEKGLSEITRVKDLLELAENMENKSADSGKQESGKSRSTIPPAKLYKPQGLGQKK